jgi:poly(3-hydroxybutyrate) depolymerase
MSDAIGAALAGPGRAAVPFHDAEGDPARLITLHCYRAPAHTPDRPVVFVQHGMGRNGDEYRDFWVEAADRHGLLIIAPTYANAEWPGGDSYNDGLPRDAAGAPRPRATWGFAALPRILARLRAAGLTTRAEAQLFGHSAGGQFVHRLLATQGAGPFGPIAVGNPGWYTMPDLDLPYPAGLGGIGLDERALAAFLAAPLLILAGEGDIDTTAANLPRGPEALRQGPHRFARAHFFLEQGHATAARLGLPCGWRLQPVPHIGHDGAAMSRVAASLWFEDCMPPEAMLARWAGLPGAL